MKRPFVNPSEVYREGQIISGDKDLPKPKVKKPHASCTTPETCIAQGRCRKTGKALVNGKVAK